MRPLALFIGNPKFDQSKNVLPTRTSNNLDTAQGSVGRKNPDACLNIVSIACSKESAVK